MPTTIDGSAGVTINNGAVLGITSGTAVSNPTSPAASASIDFTSIPSWVKRLTVIFSGVSTNGTANVLVQIGSGSVTTSGYSGFFGSSSFTTGFGINSGSAANVQHGHMVITLISGTTYVASLASGNTGGTTQTGGGTSPALSGALDRVRITTSNGTDTFDAGSVNIMYEG